MSLTPERLAELRHAAEQALHHSPMTHEWMTFHGAVTPGVVLQLLDALDAAEDRFDQANAALAKAEGH